jgi:peptidoglycan-associated lipoprotein
MKNMNPMKNINQSLFAVMVVAALAGCGSTVKLDEVPVEDKAGQTVAPLEAKTPSTVAPTTVTTLVPSKLGPPTGSDVVVAGGRIVYFDYDSYSIRPEFKAVIEAHARVLKSDKTKKANIEGHTDERGGREYNLALGQKRAESVRRALSLLGVQDAQMEAVSFGKEKPAVLGGSDAAMEKNRRAEIVVR